MNDRPVFFDPTTRRWRRVKTFGLIGLAGLGAIGLVFAWGMVVTPNLPKLVMPRERTVGHDLTAKNDPHSNSPLVVEPTFTSARAARRMPSGGRTLAPSNLRANVANAMTSRGQAIGFYVNWDDNSFTSLRQNISHLDVLEPEWLHLGKSGGIVVDDPGKQARTIAFIHKTRPGLRVMPLINNYSSALQDWDSAGLAKTLEASPTRARLVEHLVSFVQEHHFAGVNIDFENVPQDAQPDLERFMSELYTRFRPLGLVVHQSVPLDDPDFNYVRLATSSDALVLMAYDEHDDHDTPGSIASQTWFETLLTKRLSDVPASKIVVGLGNYGYDWTVDASGRPQGVASELSFEDALTTAHDSGATVQFDASTRNPTYRYTDDQNRAHRVWYLDAASSFNQAQAAARLGLHSLALWRMGTEDPSVWTVFEGRKQLDAATARALETVHYGYDLDYEGSGEVLKVTNTPQDGQRSLGFNPARGLIASETIKRFASPYVITRWGASRGKKIALSFDDGPDPVWTPEVLDVLKREGVPGTFFVVGSQGTAHPDLLRRIFSEGHEIGSHTYTHPNLSLISTTQLDFELNATQRLLESELGVSTLLFRPPFAEDVEPETPEQAGVLARVGQLGYYTIGMGIDPNDWRAPGAQKIVDEVIRQAEARDGQVVLLHDAGGDRSQTVGALPAIIHILRARGYSFVSVSSLIGKSREQVMPAVPVAQQLENTVDGAGFGLIGAFLGAVGWLFVGGIALSLVRLTLIAALALLEAARRRGVRLPDGSLVPVSAIVPAYNEAKVIVGTVRSILENGHGLIEVVVVDDGSTDGTLAVIRREFGKDARVRAVRKDNGGKASALNLGLECAHHEVVVIVDADTLLVPGAIAALARHFVDIDSKVDTRLGAVAGNAKVGNRLNLLTRWQALEYITSQNLDRRAFSWLNCISVVPGAIGAWRKSLVQGVGGFSTDTLAEDADLTLRLLRAGHTVGYEPEAIARTEAPDTVAAFLKQRFRWMFGTLQAAWKHRDTLFRPRYGALGSFALPNVFVFQVFFPFISSLMDLTMIGSLVWALVQMRYHPADQPLGAIEHTLFFYLAFLAVDVLAAVIAFALERREDWRLLPWLLAQRFFYRQLMYVVAIRAAIAAVRGRVVGWGALERKATVKLEIAAERNST